MMIQALVASEEFKHLSQHQFNSVQSLSHVQLFVTPRTAALQASLSITNSQSLPTLMFIKSVMPSNQPILCHPLLLLPSIFPSIRVISNKLVLTSGGSEGSFPLRLTGLISLESRALSRVFSNTIVQKQHFFSTQSSLWSNSHIHT